MGKTMRDVVARIYAFLFARPQTQMINRMLYHLALRGFGYNNGWQLGPSGELWFIQHARPRMALDIGANRGDYAEALASSGCSVIAFEPLPAAFSDLIAMSERFPSKILAFNCAVGVEPGTLTLHYGEDDSMLASLSPEINDISYVGIGNTNTMQVQVVSIDSHFSRFDTPFIDLIKIDVEGFEYEVILGAQETIARFKPSYIQVEYNLHQLFRGHSLWSMSRLLPDYDLFQLLPKGMRRVDPKLPESNTFCYSNFVFVRRPS